MTVPTGRCRGGSLFSVPPTNDEDWGGSQFSLDFAICVVFYAAIIAIFGMVIALIVKLLRNIDGDDSIGDLGVGATEHTGLLPPNKEGSYYSMYGGTSEGDLESGKESCCCTTSSSEDLYDGKICVICYDDQRSCFFIPCGHCVTCHTCANRIVTDENKSCPICRTIINEVMKLHLLS